jgi:hypothetical protein
MRIFKEETEREVWKQDTPGRTGEPISPHYVLSRIVSVSGR